MKLEQALQTKKQELEDLQKDIDSLEDQSATLKDSVKKYNELKSKSAELKKVKKSKQRDFDTVANFFQTVDDSYLTNIFPLFSGQQETANA
jgi:hypothetical protein